MEIDTEATPFRESWKELRKCFESITETIDDPFKAPEQTIEMLPTLMNRLWVFQVEWVSLQRSPLADDFAFDTLKEARRFIRSDTASGQRVGQLLDVLITRTERGSIDGS